MFRGLFAALLFALFHAVCSQSPTFPPFPDVTPKKHNNGMMAAFIVLYILFAFINILLLVKRKSSFAPILAIHSNRSNKTTDFTAFGAKAESISHALKDLNEELLWADVSLRVPTTGTLFLILGPAIFGILLVIVITRVVPAESAAFATPVFLVLLIPELFHMVISYKQIVGGEHFTYINALTPRGAHIIQQGGCGTASHFYPYEQMVNIHTITNGSVGNVYFAEKWQLEDVKTTHAHRGHIHEHTHKEWKKHGVGFESVVQPMEVQAILIARTGGGLPPSQYPGQYPDTAVPGFPTQPGFAPLPQQPVYPPQLGYVPQPGYTPQPGVSVSAGGAQFSISLS